MALRDKPLPDDVTDSDLAVPLDETGDVEAENTEYSGAVEFIKSQFKRSEDARRVDEERWLDAYRNYRGLYSSEVQFTETEKWTYCSLDQSFQSVLRLDSSQIT